MINNNNNKKLAIVARIDKLLLLMNKRKSDYDLIIDSLSIDQLNYYLELTKDDLSYYTA